MGCKCKPSYIANGFYQCLWKTEGKKESTTIVEKIIFFFVFLIFLFCSLWLYLCGIIHNNFNDFNDFFFESLGSYFHWYLLILIVSIVIVLYLLLVFISGLYLWIKKFKLYLSICNKIFVPITLIIGIVAFILINSLYFEQYGIAEVSFEITGPLLQVCAVIVYSVFSFYLSYTLVKAKKITKITTLVLYLTFFVFLLTIPIWVFSPCIGSGINSNTKPLLIGHRGSGRFAPENTMLSFNDSLECGDFAFESDVRLSKDGIPFLMHDSNLLRTTDVSRKFPPRKNDRPETFTWNELQQLDAGSWFLQDNPFLTNHFLSNEKREKIKLQKIPSLSQLAQKASQFNRRLIFDLTPPPFNHPTTNTFVNITVQTLLNSGIDQSLVLWLNDYPDQVNIREEAPGFRIVDRSPSQESTADIFNLAFAEVTTEIISYNISTIAYVINDNWAFTRAWCQGVWAVTTDYSCQLNKINRPSWYLMRSGYLAMWIVIDLLCICLVVLAIYWHVRRVKEQSGNSLNDDQRNGINNVGYLLQPVS